MYARLNQRLLFYDWTAFYDMPVNIAYEFVVNVISEFLDELAPRKFMVIPRKEHFKEPWMSVKICKYNSKCKQLFKKARQSNNSALIAKSKMYRATLNQLKLSEKRTFYNNLFNKIGKDSKTLWSVLNSLIKKTSNKQLVVYLIENDVKVTEPKAISNCFNETFLLLEPKFSHVFLK